MKKLIQFTAIVSLMVLYVSPAQAWWNDRGYDNDDRWNNTDQRDSRWNRNQWMNGPWSGDSWDEWRAPWSNDDSRWGSGPWDGFGDAMNNFIGEMESDVDLNMKISA